MTIVITALAQQEVRYNVCVESSGEKQVPVSEFVSTLSRAMRINTKLENLPLALLSCAK